MSFPSLKDQQPPLIYSSNEGEKGDIIFVTTLIISGNNVFNKAQS